MPSSTPERVALVTGASSGIGRATAIALAREGVTVVGVARRAHRLAEVTAACREHAPGSFHLAGDVGDRAVAEHVIAEAIGRAGRLDTLVNNAAVPKHKHALRVGPDEVEHVMRVNFLSSVWTTLAALPHFLERGAGTVVNVSSFAAKVTPAREGTYAASKAAMNAFSEGLWHDLAGSGVHVAIVNPGPIDTEIWDKAEEPHAFHGHRYPPELVADAILDVVRRRRFEVTVPARHPMLVSARLVRLLTPGLYRAGMARMDPVSPAVFADAARRARPYQSES